MGKPTKINTFFFRFGLLMTLPFLVVPVGCKQAKPEGKAPAITRSFASEKGYWGHIWKIYIEAEDPDADMERIAVVVNQVGYGQYPTDWIILEPQYRGYFIGFLEWNTFSSKAAYIPEWMQIVVKVSIFDESGNKSNGVVFPLIFESGVKEENQYQLPVPFDAENVPGLGHIMIDLFDGQRY